MLFSSTAMATLSDVQLADLQAGQTIALPPRVARAGELLVKYKPHVSDAARQKKQQDKGHVKLHSFKSIKLDRVALQPGQSLLEGIRAYKGDPDIEYAEPNYVMSAQLTPNEAVFANGSQWALDNPGTLFPPGGIDVRAKLAWDITTGSPDVVVAVIDSGIDRTHIDLTGNNFWVNTAEANGLPGVDDDGNGFVDDVYGIDTVNLDSNPQDDFGHGTKVASILGATTNNSLGMAGMAWNVKMLACKAGNSLGSIPIDATISCLDYVKTMKARGVNIIATNNSYGAIGAFSQAMRDAIDAQRDILYIAAAGNFGIDNDLPGTAFYPASYDLPNVIAVAATNATDTKPVWSHFGRRTVHLGAPGENIYAADLFNAFALPSGTSMAAPLVTGVAVLLKAQDPTRDWRALKNLLITSGAANASLADKTISGRRLDALGALTCANRPLFSAVKVAAGAQVGVANTLSAISVNCANAVGPVTATTSSGQVITLTDDGVAPDQAAGDGLFTANFTPNGSYAFIDFTSPLGTERVGTPDLTVSGVSGPGFVDLGAAITLNATVNNVGTVAAGTSTINFYLSTDSVINPATDTLLGSVAVPGIGAGSSAPITAGLAVPPGLASGSYFVGAVVDPDNTMIEAVETNNTAVSGLAVLVGAPPVDLSLTALTAPATATRGNPIAVSTTVANTGSIASGASTVTFYLSTDAVITPTDTVLGSVQVPAVLAGGTQVASGSFTVPPAVANGSYFVGAIADADNQVIETNETNNSRAAATATTVSTAPVDLNFTSMSGPSSARVGQNVSLSATLRNSGTASVASPSITFYISNNNIIDATDTPMGTVTTTTLAGGASRTITATLPVPGTVTAGTRWWGVIADQPNLIVETNEANNTRLGNSTSVTVAADLVMTAAGGPATAVTGQTITVTGTLKNQGSAAVNVPTEVGWYLSSDATITTADRFLGSTTVASIANGVSTPVSGSFVIPQNLSPGTYRIGAIADRTSAVRESSETNNTLAGNSIVIGVGPDLVVSALSGPATGTAGTPITLNATVTNQGVGVAEVMDLAGNRTKTRIGFYLSSDALITTADTFLGFVSFDALANGQSVPIVFTGTIPSTLRGTYYIGAIVDYQNQLVEANESNNARAGNTIVLTIGGQMILETVP